MTITGLGSRILPSPSNDTNKALLPHRHGRSAASPREVLGDHGARGERRRGGRWIRAEGAQGHGGAGDLPAGGAPEVVLCK